MIKRDSIVPASRVDKKEFILSTLLKVYAIRAEVEERAGENRFRNIPLLGSLATKLASPALSKSQHRDATAFVTATCTSNEALVLMEQVAGFKEKIAVNRPAKILLSYAGLVLPLLLVILAEAYMFYISILAQMSYLAIAIGLILLAVAASIVAFAHLGYDATYRRDLIERAIWKAMHEEAVRRLKKSGVIKSHAQLTPRTKAEAKE